MKQQYRQSYRQFYFNYHSIILFLVMLISWSALAQLVDTGIRRLLKETNVGIDNKKTDGKWETFDITDGLPGSRVEQVAVAPDERTFYLIMDRGWCRFTYGEVTQLPSPGGYEPSAISVAPDGTPWLTSRNVRKYGLSVLLLDDIHSLGIDDFCNTIHIAQNGNIWFGTRFSGKIIRFKPSLMELPKPPVYGFNDPLEIVTTPDGSVWSISSDGYAVYKNRHWNAKNWPVPEISIRSPQDVVASVFPDSSVWITFSNHSAVIVKDGTSRFYESLFQAIDNRYTEILKLEAPLNMRSWALVEKKKIIAGGRIRTSGGWFQIKVLAHLEAEDFTAVYSFKNDDIWFFTKKGIYRSIHGKLGNLIKIKR